MKMIASWYSKSEVKYKQNMISSKMPILLLTSILFCIFQVSEQRGNAVTKPIESKALSSYRSSCLRLQNIAKWMTVLFKLKSAWTNTTTKIMMENPLLRARTNLVPSIPELPKRHGREIESECSSLQNLQMTLQGYVHFQAQLLQLKAVMGNIILQRALSKINDSVALKNRFRGMEFLNRTTSNTIEKLKILNKLSSYGINNNDLIARNTIKSIKNAPKLLRYFQEQTTDIFENLINVTKSTDSFKQTQNLVRTGDFFKNIGETLDNFFFKGVSKELQINETTKKPNIL